MVAFDPTKPVTNALRDSATMRNQLNSLFNGDCSPLRPRAQVSPNLTVAISGTDVESFWRQTWVGLLVPLNYAGGNSPSCTAPTTNSRISLLTIDSSGTLEWTHGDQASSPTPPNSPADKVPICWVYARVGMTAIYNYEDAGSYPSQGYIYKDIRPLQNLGGTTQLPTVTFAYPSTLAVVASATPSFIMPFSGTITKAYAYSRTAPTGQSIIIDINKNGSTIWSTQANRLAISAGQNSGTQTAFNTTALVESDRLDLDIDQIGSGTVGANLTVELKVSR